MAADPLTRPGLFLIESTLVACVVVRGLHGDRLGVNTARLMRDLLSVLREDAKRASADPDQRNAAQAAYKLAVIVDELDELIATKEQAK